MKLYDKEMKRLCRKYKIKLFDAATDVEQSKASYYQGHSASAGGDDIMVGIYSDPEVRYFSFLHELGHCLAVQRGEAAPTIIEREIKAWIDGMAFAKTDPGPAVVEYMLKCLHSYSKGKHNL